MPPLAALPRGLRQEVLECAPRPGPLAQAYRQDVLQRAGPFRPNGFPQATKRPWPRLLALSGVAAAAGILIAVVATGIVTVLALDGSHTPQQVDAARSGRSPGSAPASVTASPGSAGAARRACRRPPARRPSSARRPRPHRLGLAHQGEAVTVGHVLNAALPHADAALPTPRPTLTPTATPTPTSTATATPTPTFTPL